MRKKLMSIMTIIFIISLLLTACAAPTTAPEEPAPAATEAPAEPEEPAAPTEEPAQPEEPAAEPVKLSLYSLAWIKDNQDMTVELISQFNEEHKGKIEIEYIQGDWGEVENYITSGVAGGGGIADIIEGDTGMGLGWYEQGFLTDLTPYITDEIRATMPEEYWASRTAGDGKIFLSGTVTGSEIIVFYNPKVLEKAGIEPSSPDNLWSWEQLVENAKLLTLDANGKHLGEEGFDAANVVQWGFVPRLDNEKIWEEGGIFVMQSTGKPMIRKGDDGVWDIFFDDAAIPVLESYLNIVNVGITPEKAIGLTGDSQNELFAQGQAAMILRGYFNISVLKGLYPDFDFAVMPIPMSSENKEYYVDNWGQGFGIPVTSEHPAEAAEFIFWIQQAVQNAKYASSISMAPVNPDALQDPVLLNDPNWDTMRFYRSIEKLVVAEYNTNTSEFVTSVYAPTMMAVVSGEKTLQQAIEEIKALSKDILNQ
ncbi:MAG: extracellular solute-binding protein [Chloroflexi bacterium]|nr:extracellular solute-binding protein [Chloroflexota bacterium]